MWRPGTPPRCRVSRIALPGSSERQRMGTDRTGGSAGQTLWLSSPRKHIGEVLNPIFYVLSMSWQALPKARRQRSTAHSYFVLSLGRHAGAQERIHHALIPRPASASDAR